MTEIERTPLFVELSQKVDLALIQRASEQLDAVFHDWRSRGVDAGIHEGIVWLTLRNPVGAVNGYVVLPEGHPWATLDLVGAHGIINIHGGVTLQQGSLVGFHTVHYGDVWQGFPDWGLPDVLHWTPEMVRAEARCLAELALAASKQLEGSSDG